MSQQEPQTARRARTSTRRVVRAGAFEARVVIAIDTGGSFTDLVAYTAAEGVIAACKVQSVPSDPASAIEAALEQAHGQLGDRYLDVDVLAHGTTVPTNALLERRGARAVLLVTAGFRDVLFLARQTRPDLYEPFARRTQPVVPRAMTVEVLERTRYDGSIERRLTPRETRRVVNAALALDPESVAICLLHSFVNAEHEGMLAEAFRARRPDLPVTTSAELSPTIGEYERASTCSINAYIGPLVEAYLQGLQDRIGRRLPARQWLVMQSHGGLSPMRAVAGRSVETILSGPAAGVVAAARIGSISAKPHLLSVDMGGTSFDISVLPGHQPEVGSSLRISGLPVSTPSLVIETIGAGGGSIAWVDSGGALRVGPRSAGSVPGPASYAAGGTEPTVTDAHVVLGRLGPSLLGGGLTLDRELAARAIYDRIARPLELSLRAAAQGILQVINAHMARAMRVASIARGYDPRDMALVAFGGAGPLHAAELADELQLDEILIPPVPGATSAAGLADADIQRELFTPVLLDLDVRGYAAARKGLQTLERTGRQWMRTARVNGAAQSNRGVFMSYRGQSHSLQVPVPDDPGEGLESMGGWYETEHRRRYGFVLPEAIVITGLRVGLSVPVTRRTESQGAVAPAIPSSGVVREVSFGAEPVDVIARPRASLAVGESVAGPLIFEQTDTTILIPSGWRGIAHANGSLVLTHSQASRV